MASRLLATHVLLVLMVRGVIVAKLADETCLLLETIVFTFLLHEEVIICVVVIVLNINGAQ